MLNHGKRDYLKLVPILAPDWDELDDEPREQVLAIAQQVMEKSLEIFNEKAKFAVVGQIYYTHTNGSLRSWDPSAEKVHVGFFNTERQAELAAESLHGPAAGSELLRTWVLPIWHDTPAAWRKSRRNSMMADQAEMDTQASRLSKKLTGSPPAQCERQCPDEETGDFMRCVRAVGHPGTCFSSIPSMGSDL